MPTPISDIKAVNALHHFFTGLPQLKIAQKCGVNQSTVSRCAGKFEEEAVAKGILAAAEEYQIMNEVTALRSLATDLYKNKSTIEQAKAGLKMVVLFNSLDVPPEEYKVLAKAFKKLKDPEFPKSGIKLVKMEDITGKSYTDIVKEFEALGEEIVGRQKEIAALKEKQAEEEKSLEELELNLEQKEAELTEFLKKAEEEKTAADTEVKEKLAEAGFTLEKVEKLRPVVEKMSGLGISDEKLDNFVIEHQVLEDNGITWEKFQKVAVALAKAGEINGDNLVAKLKEFGDLDEVITSMKTEEISLQPVVEKLGKIKMELTVEVDELAKSKAQLEKEVGHLEGSKKALEDTIETLQVRRAHLEKHLEQLENDIAKLEANKAVLKEEADQKHREIDEISEKIKEAGDIDQKLKELREELLELDNKKAAVGSRFGLFEAFLGLVDKRGVPEIEEFQKFMPTLVKEAKTGKYDPGFLVDTILGQLSGGTLDRIRCDYCGAEFVMLKRAQKVVQGTQPYKKMTCPDCGGSLKTVVITPLSSTLKKVIITGTPTMEISRTTPPKEENQTDHPEAEK